MARVTTYLNFPRETEAAFAFYKTVFGTDYASPILRFGDMPGPEGAPAMSEADQRLVMHVALPILGGHVLMGTDAPETRGFALRPGNNVYLNLEPDSRAEARRLFAALAEGGVVQAPLADMPWGALWGSLTDRFGIQWMMNCQAQD